MRQMPLAFFVILWQACSCRRALHDRFFRSLRGGKVNPDPELGDCFQPFMGWKLWRGVDGCKHDAIGSCACCGRRWLQAAHKVCAKSSLQKYTSAYVSCLMVLHAIAKFLCLPLSASITELFFGARRALTKSSDLIYTGYYWYENWYHPDFGRRVSNDMQHRPPARHALPLQPPAPCLSCRARVMQRYL